jgi:membrane-associated phospholipid phosphatase
VFNGSPFPQNGAAFAIANPLGDADHQIAGWFHAHLSHAFVHVLRALSEPGAAEWIGLVLFVAVALLLWKRAWPALGTIIIAVPGGMLLNELVKLAVHRHRPFVDGWFVDWSGYSFASGHTIGATLLYGQLLLFVLPLIKSKRRQTLVILLAAMLVMLVGFSRIALGAHYLTDVVGAIFLGTLWLMLCAILFRPLQRRVVVPIAIAQEPAPTIPTPVQVMSESSVSR